MTLILRRVFFAGVVIALIVVVRLFPDQNQDVVDIDLLLTSVEGVHLWFALAATFASGAALALFVSSLLLVKAGLVGRRYRKAIADLEAEVHHLRNLPLATGDLQDEFDSVAGNPVSHASRAKGS
ncbi:MAG: LapA family protein [Deltaproteobacteria bacterium]|nr:LapA family protein [Deltaproteobacteria bacterium]MBW2724712.1 LapA family protein [Deltaproteobacteria bacterium]